MKNSLLAAIIGMTLLCGLACAQDGSAGATIQSLQQDQQQLRADLNVLRAELHTMQKTLDELQKTARGGGSQGNAPTVGGPTFAELDKKLDRIIADLQTIKSQSPAAKGEQRRPVMDLIGKPAPAFSLATTVGGQTISNNEFGKYGATVLNFVAPNCGFCTKQIPAVEKLRQVYQPAGVRFINVSQQMGQQVFSPQEAEAKYVSLGSKLEIAIDTENAVGKLFSATAYPTMVVIGRNGIVAQANVGAKDNIEEVLRQQLDSLLNPTTTTQPQRPDAGSKGEPSPPKPPATPQPQPAAKGTVGT
jgi:thiol-disulfide isomerase/thioredoxin